MLQQREREREKKENYWRPDHISSEEFVQDDIKEAWDKVNFEHSPRMIKERRVKLSN